MVVREKTSRQKPRRGDIIDSGIIHKIQRYIVH